MSFPKFVNNCHIVLFTQIIRGICDRPDSATHESNRKNFLWDFCGTRDLSLFRSNKRENERLIFWSSGYVRLPPQFRHNIHHTATYK
jgi:hypothetical protein